MRRTRKAGRSQRYYRTAALLGPQERPMAVQAPATRRGPTKRTPAARRPSQAASAPAARQATAGGRTHYQYVAEAHLPRRARTLVIPWRWVTPLLVLVALGLWVAFGNAWYLMWDDLKVTGVFAPELRREVKIASDLLGWHSLMLHPEEAEAAVAAVVPQAMSVNITCRTIPASCEIAIMERVPILVWMDGATAYWVDREGVFYQAQGQRPDLPVIRGTRPIEDGPHSLASIQQGITALGVLGVPQDQLEYAPQQGLIWTDPEGRRVAFGVGADMAERWQTYEALVGNLAARGISPQVVDVRFPDGATYSLQRSW
jgi:hypothetical protein